MKKFAQNLHQFKNFSMLVQTFYAFCYRYEAEVYMEWVKGVDEVAKTNLEKPLLVRGVKESGDVLKVNFDPKVQRMLV